MKRRITLRQTERIQRSQQRRIEKITGEQQEGLLVAHYGSYVDVEAASGEIIRCNLRQSLGIIVVGDHVVWCPTEHELGIVVAVLPRDSLLSRPAAHGQIKAIAANVDQMIIVVAVQPKPAVSLIDSYLVAAEALNLPTAIVLNKIDLLDETEKQQWQQQLAIYEKIGYPVVWISCEQQRGIETLSLQLQQHTSILVGQSGVGKTSIISALLPDEALRIAEKSEEVFHGVHTTTTSRLYHLVSGGDVIDSPGVREFALWHMTPQEIAAGFVEFHDYLGLCKFRDCQHREQDVCALQQAVIAGKISAARLQSYHWIISAGE